MNKIKPTRHIIISKYIKPVSLLLCTAAVAMCVIPAGGPLSDPVAAATATDSKVQSYEDRIKQIEKDMSALKNNIASSQQNIEAMQQEKQNLDSEIKLMLDKIELTNELIAELERSIEEKTEQIGEKQTLYEEKYELFKERLRVTHEEGEANYLQMIFGAESLSDFLVRIDRIGAMLEYDTMIMNSLTTEKSDLEDARADLAEKKAAQEVYAAQLKQDKADLDKKSAEAAAYISKMQQNTAAYQAQMAKDEKEKEKLLDDIEKRLKELEAQNNAKYVGGELMWPVSTKYTRVSSECEWRTSPITGKKEFHNGLDIPADFGADVYAANSGTVITATYHWSYGNYVMIDHGGGIVTLYAHNSKLLVKVGDKVTRGQVIAKVGSTGSSTGNHCHFSVYEKGNIVNPRKYFQ
ncbi:MAG: peptidoglycan DD-metalloendopeptidase family protein [Clostridiales bacterium]|nr:peptidoglycan DD-metalloendopeptidase family protein [Clostridiales bacterium]